MSVATPVAHVVCNFTVNGHPVQDHPVDFELRQAWGQHDIFFARLVIPKGRQQNLMKAWPDGAAVTVTWGRNPQGGITTWYGYINHHAVTTNDDMSGQNVQITYILIGTSAVMNGDKNRTWTNVTPTAIAQRIARENSLRCVVTQTHWILPYEVQAHESDFLFLNRIADKVGFRFFVSGGTMYFIDPIVLLAGRTTSAVPTYTINKQAYLQDYARDFKVLQGASMPGAFNTMTRTIYGIDARTGQVFQTNADVSPSETDFIVNTTRRVSSRQEAKHIQNAQQALSQFWIAGSASVFGTPLLYPGKSVNILGTAVPNNNSAGWIVTAATHVGRLSGSPDASQDSLVTRLNLATNQKKNIPYIKGIHQVVPEMISCNLAGGKWRAASLNVIIEGTV